MPNKCFVNSCKSGYLINSKKLKAERKNVRPMFHPPQVTLDSYFFGLSFILYLNTHV